MDGHYNICLPLTKGNVCMPDNYKLEQLAFSMKRKYIPHHGVYHSQKKKIREVFACAASFQGTSVNTQLLQGPDLISSSFKKSDGLGL